MFQVPLDAFLDLADLTGTLPLFAPSSLIRLVFFMRFDTC